MFTLPLELHLGPSRRLAVVLGVAHAVGAGIPWAIGMPAWLAAPASLVVAGWGAWQVRDRALRRPGHAVVGLRLAADGTVTVRTRSGGELRGALSGTPLAWQTFVLLRLRHDNGALSTELIWQDACERQAFRHLHVFLGWGKWRATPGAPDVHDVMTDR